jgi:hypothetical protein
MKEEKIKTLIDLADNLTKEGSFNEAIKVYAEAQSLEKNNIEITAKKGFTLLLMGNKKAFITLYYKIKHLISKSEYIPISIQQLWKKYESIFVKVIAASIVLATVTISCRTHKHKGYHSYYACVPYEKVKEIKNKNNIYIQELSTKQDFA